MTIMKKIAGFSVIFILVAGAQNGQAQFILPYDVFGNGAQSSAGNDFQIIGTVGQPVVGIVSNAVNIHQVGFWILLESVVTGVEQISEAVPKQFELKQNYPNPFNPGTTIQFSLPKKSKVTLKIFDLLGREVATLLKEEKGPGEYKLTFAAKDMASGAYFYRLQAGGLTASRKMTLVK
ncbi:MAG: T9SS type A sorting domain-containing protein [bacterium]